MSETTQEVIDRLRRLVDDQEGGDAVVLVQRQLFNRTVGRIEAQAKRIAELEAALEDSKRRHAFTEREACAYAEEIGRLRKAIGKAIS